MSCVLIRIRGVAFCFLLVSSCFAQDPNAARAAKISKKVLCSCGCREVLNECSHKQCERKPVMQRTIASELAEGKTDDQVLAAIGQAYGSDVLLVPGFQGFDTLLWIVPVAAAVSAVSTTIVLQKRRKKSGNQPN